MFNLRGKKIYDKEVRSLIEHGDKVVRIKILESDLEKINILKYNETHVEYLHKLFLNYKIKRDKDGKKYLHNELIEKIVEKGDKQ